MHHSQHLLLPNKFYSSHISKFRRQKMLNNSNSCSKESGEMKPLRRMLTPTILFKVEYLLLKESKYGKTS
jgi:hypothetical protein